MTRAAQVRPELPLAELERVLEEACGVALSPGVRQTLGDGFLRAARESGVAAEPFLRRVLGGEARAVTLLVEHAVVGETYFFRHPEQLAVLAQRLIAPQRADRPIRAWSAGCATGEEPYTLAMLLLEAGRSRAQDRILATDVSARALAAARAGHYGQWSLRRIEPSLRARYLATSGHRSTVAPELRTRIEFRRHNLVRDPPPGSDFDLILCRNVLIYFSARTAAEVLSRLAEALRPGGWLLVGPVELPLAHALPLEQVEEGGAMLLRRPEAPRPVRRRAPSRPRLARVEPSPGAPRSEAPRSEPEAAAASLPRAGQGCGPACRAIVSAALEAARAGDAAGAERLALEAAGHLCPESYLLLALAAEERGDPAGALEALRRALYLEPGLAQAHAALVPLYQRLGRPEEAARARRNALDALRGVDDDAVLPGVEPVTAGALRQALATGGVPAREPAPGSLR